MSGIRVAFGGHVVINCVHNRQKRQVTTEAQIAALGLTVGQVYDSKQHKIHRCSCCENLFVDPSDEPRFCFTCLRPNIYTLGGPLPNPIGVVNE